MKWHVLAAFAAAGLLSETSIPARAGLVIREDGIGPVKVGMKLAELNTALHENISFPSGEIGNGCVQVASRNHPHVGFMFEGQRVVRIEVDGRGPATAEGVQVGDSEAHAQKVYGSRLKVEPEAYELEEGHYLTMQSSDGKYGIRFVTHKGKIKFIFAGNFEAIQYIEGCA